MNVWIVNPFDNLPLEGNRPQRYWLMARAFMQAGHRVTLWTSDFSHATKAKRRLTAADSAEGFEVVQIPTRPYPTNVCFQRILSHRLLSRDFERTAGARLASPTASPGLVIASTPPLGLCAAALRIARRAGARFVCDIQDAWPETFERLLPAGCKWMGSILFAPMRLTARRIYRESDRVTGVSRRYAELAGRDDFHLAYHGIATDADSRTPPPRLDKRGDRHLVYAGNLGVGYDLETVVAAVARRDDLTLDIAGAGPAQDRLMTIVRTAGLGERVRFHGYLGSAELRLLLSRSDVGVIPMRDDSWVGLPYKLGDYLQAGLKVVSSLHGECGALLTRTGFGCTYERGNPDSLLSALSSLSPVTVTLPDELRADAIYSRYVEILRFDRELS